MAMQEQKQNWNWRRIFGFARMLILTLASVAITVAIFVVDEYKPAWLLVLAPAVSIFFIWFLIRALMPAKQEPRVVGATQQQSEAQHQYQQPQGEYTVFQDFDKKPNRSVLFIVLGIILYAALLYLVLSGGLSTFRL